MWILGAFSNLQKAIVTLKYLTRPMTLTATEFCLIWPKIPILKCKNGIYNGAFFKNICPHAFISLTF